MSKRPATTTSPPALTAGRLLLQTVGVVRWQVVGCVTAAIVWQGVAVAGPWTLEKAVDQGLVGDDRAALLGWSGLLVGLGVVRWVGDARRHWWVERSGALAAAALRRRLHQHVLTLDEAAAARFSPGDLVSRSTNDVRVVWGWMSGLATFSAATFTLLAVTLLLLTLGPALATAGMVTVVVTAAVTLCRVGSQRRAAGDAAVTTGAFANDVEDALAGIRAIKGVGGEEVTLRRLRQQSDRQRDAAISLAATKAAWLSIATFVPTAAVAVGIWIGGEQALRGELGVGVLVSYTGWMGLVVVAVQTITFRLATLGEARAAAARIAEVLDTPSGQRRPGRAASLPEAPASLPEGPASVRLEGVSVARSGRIVLADIELDIAPGEWVAVVGATGSGKSSLLRLVPGLTEPAAGRVLVGGLDVADVDRRQLRRRVAFVSQGPRLFSGSVATNLRLAAPDASDAELWHTLDAANARDVVEELVDGLATDIGDRGLALSGGQRQRVALARALLTKPSVLVLDDATSALDAPTEARVLQGLREALTDTTVLFATHRLAAAIAADRIVVLAAGGIVADGRADELLAVDGHAAVLLNVHPTLTEDA